MTLKPQTTLQTDVLIVGAGPVGLFQVFELGLLGVSCHLVDPLELPGGQCVELYANKPIYDIPGLPMCTGQELIDRLLTQIKPFHAPFHGGQLVTHLEVLQGATDSTLQENAPHFRVTTQKGLVFEVKAVVLACGVGAFLPRPLISSGLDPWLERGVFYGPIQEQIALKSPSRVWIVGGDEAALNEALQSVETLKSLVNSSNPPLSEIPEVTLIHRREQLDAPKVLIEHFERVRDNSEKLGSQSVRLRFLHGQITAFQPPSEHNVGEELDSLNTLNTLDTLGKYVHPKMQLQWVDASAQTHSAGVDMVSVNLGLSPQLGPLSEWGLEIKKKQIPVNTEDFSTHIPGVFAVGDINTYPGKKKLILSGFHEATLAAYGIAKRVFKTDKIAFEYTTASPRLHARLGVEPKRTL